MRRSPGWRWKDPSLGNDPSRTRIISCSHKKALTGLIRLSTMIRLGDCLLSREALTGLAMTRLSAEALTGLEAIRCVSDLGIKVEGVALAGLEAERSVSVSPQ